jgi:hypothetical protein
VSCPRDSLTKAFDGSEDLVSGLGPNERLRIAVRDGDVIADRTLQFEGTAMRAATKLRFVSSAKKRSNRLIQDAPLGVKWT